MFHKPFSGVHPLATFGPGLAAWPRYGLIAVDSKGDAMQLEKAGHMSYGDFTVTECAFHLVIGFGQLTKYRTTQHFLVVN